jgi:dihydroorotate dehydrogenase (fumarate)
VTDLRSRYLGQKLRSPLVASASPLTGHPDDLRRLEDAGIAAAVLPSLFEEQLTHDQVDLDRLLEQTSEHVGEALSYFPDLSDYNTGPSSYLELIQRAKRAVAIPVIASLNGTTPGGWVRHAHRMQDAGADAIELNLYAVATDPTVGAAELESRYLEVVAAVRAAITIPWRSSSAPSSPRWRTWPFGGCRRPAPPRCAAHTPCIPSPTCRSSTPCSRAGSRPRSCPPAARSASP